MFKLFVVSIIVFFVWRRLSPVMKSNITNRSKAVVNDIKGGKVDLTYMQTTASNAKERGRCLLIQVIVLMIKGLTTLLGRLMSTNKQINK